MKEENNISFTCKLKTRMRGKLKLSFLILLAIAKVRRSNSWSDVVDDFKFGEEPIDPMEVEKELHEQNCR